MVWSIPNLLQLRRRLEINFASDYSAIISPIRVANHNHQNHHIHHNQQNYHHNHHCCHLRHCKVKTIINNPMQFHKEIKSLSRVYKFWRRKWYIHISGQPIPFPEIIIEAGMVKAFWWIIQEHEKEKQEHTISRSWEPNKVYHSLWA